MYFGRLKLCISVFLLTLFYSFTVAFGMSIAHTLTLSVKKQILSSNTPVAFTTYIDGEQDDMKTYAWYINGVALEGVETASLNIEWETYTALFPNEKHEDIQKEIVVETVVEDTLISDKAHFYVDYEDNISCGDGVVQYDQGEECDDGNIDDVDGCSATCLCEGMCISLLIQ